MTDSISSEGDGQELQLRTYTCDMGRACRKGLSSPCFKPYMNLLGIENVGESAGVRPWSAAHGTQCLASNCHCESKMLFRLSIAPSLNTFLT